MAEWLSAQMEHPYDRKYHPQVLQSGQPLLPLETELLFTNPSARKRFLPGCSHCLPHSLLTNRW